MDTFRDELANGYPDHGHALWDPDPCGLYDAVQVGDVGFIRKGYFCRLFNALHPDHHPSDPNVPLNPNVPPNPSVLPDPDNPPSLDHPSSPEPRDIPEYPPRLQPKTPHIRSYVDNRRDFCSKNITKESYQPGGNPNAFGPDDDAQVKVTCSGEQGALLSLPFPAECEDTVALGVFGKWLVKNINHCLRIAEDRGLGIRRTEDIILVTGRHLARSWINVTFSEPPEGAEVCFSAIASGTSGVRLEGRGIRGGDLKLGPSGEDLPKNQCIFIRGYRVVRFLNIWPRLQAMAEPAPDMHDPEPESDTRLELIGVPADADHQDPLHVLLEYIAEQAPDCDMALVHDDDLGCIDVASLETALQPGALIGHFRDHAPAIRRFQCELLPGNGSGSGTEVAIATVATLSKVAFEAPQDEATISTLQTSTQYEYRTGEREYWPPVATEGLRPSSSHLTPSAAEPSPGTLAPSSPAPQSPFPSHWQKASTAAAPPAAYPSMSALQQRPAVALSLTGELEAIPAPPTECECAQPDNSQRPGSQGGALPEGAPTPSWGAVAGISPPTYEGVTRQAPDQGATGLRHSLDMLSEKYLKNIRGSYRGQAIHLFSVCRTIILTQEQAPDSEAKLRNALQLVDGALKSATGLGMSSREVVERLEWAIGELRKEFHPELEPRAEPRDKVKSSSAGSNKPNRESRMNLKLFLGGSPARVHIRLKPRSSNIQNNGQQDRRPLLGFKQMAIASLVGAALGTAPLDRTQSMTPTSEVNQVVWVLVVCGLLPFGVILLDPFPPSFGVHWRPRILKFIPRPELCRLLSLLHLWPAVELLIFAQHTERSAKLGNQAPVSFTAIRSAVFVDILRISLSTLAALQQFRKVPNRRGLYDPLPYFASITSLAVSIELVTVASHIPTRDIVGPLRHHIFIGSFFLLLSPGLAEPTTRGSEYYFLLWKSVFAICLILVWPPTKAENSRDLRLALLFGYIPIFYHFLTHPWRSFVAREWNLLLRFAGILRTRALWMRDNTGMEASPPLAGNRRGEDFRVAIEPRLGRGGVTYPSSNGRWSRAQALKRDVSEHPNPFSE